MDVSESPVNPNMDESSTSGPSQQHSIGHISGVFIRNFTPFPQRDRITSALQHSAPGNIVRQDGHGSDDLDIALSRRRGRRVSSASTTTFRSHKSEDTLPESVESETPLRLGRSFKHRPTLQGSASSVSGIKRARSSSNAASLPESSVRPLPAMPSSQRGLELVLATRLLETFITLSVIPLEDFSQPRSSLPTDTPVRPLPQSIGRAPKSTSPHRAPSRASSAASRPVGKASGLRSGPERFRPVPMHSPIAEGPSSPSSHNFPSPSSSEANINSNIPFFISSLHPPSTNPSWTSLDPSIDFDSETDLRTSKIHLVLWGRHAVSVPNPDSRVNGKGKQREMLLTDAEWHAIADWHLDLNCLQPLAHDFFSATEELHPNTIVFNLNTTGTLYVIPSLDSPPVRPPSPQENVSDGEMDVKAGTSRGRHLLTAAEEQTRRSRLRETKMKPGASWEDTVRLISLQNTVVATQKSLRDIVSSIDANIDITGPLGKDRLCEELSDQIEGLQQQKQLLNDKSDEVQGAIERLRASLRERRVTLATARDIYAEDSVAAEESRSHSGMEKTRLNHLRESLQARRGILVRIINRIFPVEAISSADLLFSILDVPLPIPVNPSDPAPPLNDPQWPHINEDSIATALGYAAQVVQLLASYMGFLVPYPITCAGSRSLIRDPISNMHGPRTFPLYSRGVDTYRFEYAVFLLNKNIEMLMTERNLQALDMRHTLPNLKNLLLTLTSEEADEDDTFRPPTATTVPTDPSHTNSPSSAAATLNGDANNTPPQTGTPTTTNVHATSRKAFFSPIADLWLSRSLMRGASAATQLPPTQEDAQGEGDAIQSPDLPTQDEPAVLTNTTAHGDATPIASEPSHGTTEGGVKEYPETGEETSWLPNGVNGLGKHLANGILFGPDKRKHMPKQEAYMPEPPPPPLPVP